jgi:hypothetical protein
MGHQELQELVEAENAKMLLPRMEDLLRSVQRRLQQIWPRKNPRRTNLRMERKPRRKLMATKLQISEGNVHGYAREAY